MGDDTILERISAMEVQIKDIQSVKDKLDSLYDLVMGMKLANANERSSFLTRQEHVTAMRDLDKRLDRMEEGKRRLFWASVSSFLVFMFWLIEQLLHIKIQFGG